MSDTKSFILEYYTVKEQDKRAGLGRFGQGLSNFAQAASDAAADVQAGSAGTAETGVAAQRQAAIPAPADNSNRIASGGMAIGNVEMGQKGQEIFDYAKNLPSELETRSKGLIDTGATALSNVAKGATSDAEAAAKRTMDYGASLAPATSRLAGSEFTQGVTSSLGKTFSDPKTLAKLGAGALATGALVGGGMALGNRLFGRRPEKKKKRSTAISLTASYNPYARTGQELGGAFGATSGSLGGLLGGRYAATKAADALGLKQGGIGRTALEIGGQALGTVAGGTLGGMAGWELGKKRKKKNEMLPQSMYS